MILEYQKEQQNKPSHEDISSGDKFKYVPNTLLMNGLIPTIL